MKKRLIALCTALILALTCIPFMAFAGNIIPEGTGSAFITNNKADIGTGTIVWIRHKSQYRNITTPEYKRTDAYGLNASITTQPGILSLSQGQSDTVKVGYQAENVLQDTVDVKNTFTIRFCVGTDELTNYYDITQAIFTFTPVNGGPVITKTISYLDPNGKPDGQHKVTHKKDYILEESFSYGSQPSAVAGATHCDFQPGEYKIGVTLKGQNKNNDAIAGAFPKVSHFGTVVIPKEQVTETGLTDLSGERYIAYTPTDGYQVTDNQDDTFTIAKTGNDNRIGSIPFQLYRTPGSKANGEAPLATTNLTINGVRQNTVAFEVDATKGSLTGVTEAEGLYTQSTTVAGVSDVKVPTVSPVTGWTFLGWDIKGVAPGTEPSLPPSAPNVSSPSATDITYVARFTEDMATVSISYQTEAGVMLQNVVEVVNDIESPLAFVPTSEPMQVGSTFTPPQAPELLGYEYVGIKNLSTNEFLDGGATEVTGNSQYAVVYREKNVTVRLQLDSVAGNLDDVQLSIPFNSKLTAPTATMTEGYVFSSWTQLGYDVPFDFSIRLREDVELAGRYTRLSYAVNFLPGEHGTLQGDVNQQVYHGESAVAPAYTAEDGWEFSGWDTDFSKVTGALTVTALWREEGAQEEPPIVIPPEATPLDPGEPITPPARPVVPTEPTTPPATPGGDDTDVPTNGTIPGGSSSTDNITIPEEKTPLAPGNEESGRKMAILDLVLFLAAIVLAAVTFVKKSCNTKKAISVVIAVLAGVVFFLTQPLVLQFKLADIWALLLGAGLIGQIILLAMGEKKEEK